MNLYLFLIPGALFLLVLLFRVGLPYLKNPTWKHILDNARYYRYMEKFEKSDALLERAVEKYADKPHVYADYFLNHSKSTDLRRRVEVLKRGVERTGDTALSFFLGNAFLENGDFTTARKYLATENCRSYMVDHKIPLFAQLLYEEGTYMEAETEFLNFYRLVFNLSAAEDVLSDLSAGELVLYALILKAREKNWHKVMDRVPKTSFHSDMSWKDYLTMIKDQYGELKPAETGIDRDPSEFNRRRNEYFKERIKLVEGYL